MKIPAITALAFLTLMAPSQAAVNCAPATIWANSGSAGNRVLQKFEVNPSTGDLEMLRSYPIHENFGDIALSPDGSALMGVTFDVASPELVRFDLDTGAVASRTTLTSDEFGDATVHLNSLSFAQDGRLYAGGPNYTSFVFIDPSTGVWELSATHQFPTFADGGQLTAAGDFLTLAGGDVLAVLRPFENSNGWAYLARFDSSLMNPTIVASVHREIYGAAQSGGRIYLASRDGSIYTLDAVPETGSENNDITDQLRVAWNSNHEWWGAASAQDSGGCELVVDDDDSDAPGPTVTPRAPVRVDTGR